MKQAKAVYAFTARNENEISFEVGEEIHVLEEDQASGWAKGRTKEYREGYFPMNYVIYEDVSDSDDDNDEDDTTKKKGNTQTNNNTTKIQCVALYDFTALASTQLSFRKGLIINITKKGNENDWWEGELDGTHQTGLFPSNYVQLIDPPSSSSSSSSSSSTTSSSSSLAHSGHYPDTTSSVNQPSASVQRDEKVQSQIAYPFHEVAQPSHKQQLIRVGSTPSDTSAPSEKKIIEQSEKNAVVQSASSSAIATRSVPANFQNSFATRNLNVLPPEKEFSALSPVSPNLTLPAYNSLENARRRPMSMQFSSSPLNLSFNTEGSRDFDALCLLYPFLPSSIGGPNTPTSQAPFTPSKLPTSASQPIVASPPSTPLSSTPSQQPIQISPPQHLLQSRPQSAPQYMPHSTPRSTSQPSVPATTLTPPQPTLSTSPSTPSPSQSLQSSPSKPVVPKLTLSSSSSERKDRYAHRERDRGERSDRSERSSSLHASSSKSLSRERSQKYSSSKRADSNASLASSNSLSAVSAAGGSKRKVKLEGSLVMGKRPISTMSHSNSVDNVLDSQDGSAEQPQVQQVAQQQSEVDFLKQVLQQEVEVRMHLESIVHDAHGKLTSASQYIKDLKAELFQAHMDTSQLRVTNRQLSEQLNKYEMVTRVTVATQTDRDENIDKLRVLMEQIHELEANTELLNDQIAALKAKNSDKSPRSPIGDKGIKDLSLERSRSRTTGEASVRVDYEAVKQQFAKVRECIQLDKEEKERLIAEKVQTQEKIHKIEQQGKQIRRKLLTELQLKSDLNVRNQQVEFQLQKLKDEVAVLKQQQH